LIRSNAAADAGASLEAHWLGRERFGPCLERQLARREAILEGTAPPTLYMVEHPPVLTVGRRGSREDVLWTPDQLEARGVEVCDTPRGGEVTLHAPGQLVVYPVIRIGKQIRAHIVRLAEVTIAVLRQYGIEGAEFRMDHPGVWLGTAKIASIGIHVSRGVTVQGLSMNVDVDPGLFAALVSCGLAEVRMVSMRTVLGGPEAGVPGLPELARRWASSFAEASGFELRGP